MNSLWSQSTPRQSITTICPVQYQLSSVTQSVELMEILRWSLHLSGLLPSGAAKARKLKEISARTALVSACKHGPLVRRGTPNSMSNVDADEMGTVSVASEPSKS